MKSILQSFDFSGIDDKYIEDIKDACFIFQNFEFLCATPDVWLRMPGDVFGKPHLSYSIGQCKDGIHVQVGKNTLPNIFQFGVYIFKEDGQTKILPYMNGLLC